MRRVNKYTTTLHALNSAIVKLSKLTKAETVYRGVHDFTLPDKFWTPNRYNVRGGIDGAFMSTTLDRMTAISVAQSGKTAPIIFEIQQGMIDRGADISFLSQYPFEKEILFNPLTGLEVRGSRVEGSVLIVEVKLSVNLTSLTIEQVIGKRKKMLQDMVFGLEAEVRQALRTEGLATAYGTERVLGEFRKDVEEDELGHPSEGYNGDERLAEALQGMLQARRQYGLGGQRRAESLAHMTAEEVGRCGFEPKAYVPKVVEALKGLEHEDKRKRDESVEILKKLETAALAPHGVALVAKLEHPDANVRTAVAATLGRLDGSVLAQHAAVLVAKLEHSDEDVRRKVKETLATLDVATLAQHGAELVKKLNNSDQGVRVDVVATLAKLDREALAQHAAVLVATLKDTSVKVRKALVTALGKLDATTLVQHAIGLVAKLDDPEPIVRSGIRQMLQKIDPELLAQHGVEIMFETKVDVSERTKPKKPIKGTKKTKKAEE